MPGRGPAPKDPAKRARTNKEIVPLRVVIIEPTNQPRLPESIHDADGVAVDYPRETVEWWEDWGASPFAPDFTAQDWHSLKIAAVMHARFWLGDVKAASELRLWQQNFPATPGDRLRLRIQVAQAVDAEVTVTQKVSSARDRLQGIRKASS